MQKEAQKEITRENQQGRVSLPFPYLAPEIKAELSSVKQKHTGLFWRSSGLSLVDKYTATLTSVSAADFPYSVTVYPTRVTSPSNYRHELLLGLISITTPRVRHAKCENTTCIHSLLNALRLQSGCHG
jgi:hypothetical protein